MNSTHGARTSHRDTLLDALQSIIMESGVQEVTLDSVAARAGVTKGGLIYHFKSKEALLLALTERLRAQVDAYCVDPQENPQDSVRKFLIARINYAFNMNAQEKKLMANLLMATGSYPSLLGPVKSMYDAGTGELALMEDSAGLALSVWTALDGFVLLEMLNIRHFSALEKQQMQAALITLVEQQLTRPRD
ncbi:TetR family transcriptional regulator [Duganella sp. FT80W]|uniref:TetR family transcriptional regulator n=1 Tax=Duganella guangzhouensis TaxID=2666084 RepID=A0A6I2L1D4_9BURK|nr:TetR/AcrR family transcriptional regulator [Duganella guangzhouensis]MRW91998.1 TetR family transcriptional regulator [Duganella guangzhouensis]